MKALVDTGSNYTLLTEKTTKRIGGVVNTRRNPPRLQGVTGSPLRILGMVNTEINIGNEKVCRRWFPVVPDSYISVDLLLGCDILNQAKFCWDATNNVMVWGDASYIVHHISRNKKNVCRVREDPVTLKENPEGCTQIHVKLPLSIGPYQSKFTPIPVKEAPDTTLIIYPQPRFFQNTKPCLVKVNEENNILLPLMNHSKKEKTYNKGTILGSYEKVEDPISLRVNATHQIHNELVPKSDDVKEEGTRIQRLAKKINEQDWSHLSPPEQSGLRELILQHDPLFILSDKELGLIKGPPAHIKITDPQPSRAPMYRYPEQAKTQITEMLQDMEEREIIEPSTAAWLSPIVLVNKPDGSKRMCLDYRHVNKHLATDIYPLPRLEELVEQAAGHKYYVTLDMREAYFQILLDEESRDLTTFSDGVTLYRFRRLPFGLNCSPAIFSRQIASVLAPLLQKGWVKNYLDDLILWATDFAELLSRLKELFGLLTNQGIKLNLSKCTFGLKEVTFLGHLISEEGSKPTPKNVESVLRMKAPTTVKQVRRFLGMVGFYRKHIPSFAKIAAPLTNLTKIKVGFSWTPTCQEAFECLKSHLVKAPILVKAQTDQPFLLTTDASDTHVGGVLSQIQPDGNNCPVGYFSKKLNPGETRYSVTDKEALAIVLACRNFHHYLWGTRFTVFTDHQPLTSVFKRKTKSARMNRWILEMREYNYDIQYVRGKDNFVADHLSRPVRIVTRTPVATWLGYDQNEYKVKQREDPVWQELAEYLEGGRIPTKRLPKATLDQFAIVEEILYFMKVKPDGSLHYNLIVPRLLIRDAIRHAHELSGHLGQKKTIQKAEELFYWANLRVDVCNYVKQCITCQRFKGTQGLSQQYKELPPVHKPLERIGIDLTDMVSGSQSFRYVLTVIDHYSRFVRFFPLKTKHTTHVVDALRQYLADYGAPSGIVVDNGGEFTSQEFQKFCQQYQITLYYTTPYHPQGNGVTERMHRTLKSVLSALCQGHPLRWPTLLQPCQSIMNQAVHTSTGQQPFFGFFSRYPPRLVGAALPTIDGGEEELAAAHALISETHQKMTRRYRDNANKKRKNQSVEIGTLVWVKKETTLPGTCRKLNVKWDGPYRVCDIKSEYSVYVVENVFTGKRTRRAAAQVKPYYGSEGWLLEPLETEFEPDPVDEHLPPRVHRPPRRLIEEC